MTNSKKFNFAFIFTAMLSLVSPAQDSTKTILLGLSSQVSYNTIGPNINLALVGNYKKHTLFIGPLLASDVDPSQNSYLPGLQLGYQIYPNGRTRAFSFFLEYNFNYLAAKLNSGQTNFVIDSTKYTGERTIDIFSNAHFLSYGFNLHFLKYFYFTVSTGLGPTWNKVEFIYKANTGQVFTQGSDIIYGLNGLIKLGIGCNFLKI